DIGARAPRAPESSGVLRAEPRGPKADGFVRDLNPAREHQFGYIAQAYAEAIVEPHTPTDDLRREAVAFVERWSGRRLEHCGMRADHHLLDNARPSARQRGSYPPFVETGHFRSDRGLSRRRLRTCRTRLTYMRPDDRPAKSSRAAFRQGS